MIGGTALTPMALGAEVRGGLHPSLSGDTLQPMKATLAEPEIVTRQGKPVSAIVPIKDYEKLLQRVEDAGDAMLQEIWRIKDKLSASYGHEMDTL